LVWNSAEVHISVCTRVFHSLLYHISALFFVYSVVLLRNLSTCFYVPQQRLLSSLCIPSIPVNRGNLDPVHLELSRFSVMGTTYRNLTNNTTYFLLYIHSCFPVVLSLPFSPIRLATVHISSVTDGQRDFYLSVPPHTSYHRQWRTQEFFFGLGGGVQKIHLRTENRERGSGGGSPLVRGSGGRL
jgi:hypothetical protein